MIGPPVVRSYRDQAGARPALLWRFDEPMVSVASAPFGGGIGMRSWIVNAQIALEYDRTDLAAHLEAIATGLGCSGSGVGFLTAAPVEQVTEGADGEVVAYATVGLRHPIFAAAPHEPPARERVGTINIVVDVPVALTEAALVNAVITCTEAKSQALADHGVAATGTASDAVCIVCSTSGEPEPFAGPRSAVGARLARAVHTAVGLGTARAWTS
jgi:adenosylcobinamide hydrolase